MKRLGGVYDQIWQYDNLLSAFVKVRRGHGEKTSIIDFQRNLADNLSEISGALRSGNPCFGDYHFFTVYDPKERLICAAAVRERVMHHAVINVVGRWLERPLIDDCYACRKGYGQFKAIAKSQHYLQRCPYYLKMDVRKYFDSIRHDVMMELLRRTFKDARLLDLFSTLLDSYCTEPGQGLPIGNLTSQYLANLYLSAFDHYATETAELSGYVRYMDDMLAFGAKDTLLAFRRKAFDHLHQTRELTLKEHGGYINRSTRGVEFLGFRAFKGALRLNRRSKRRFIHKLTMYDAMLHCGEIDESTYQQRSTALFSFVHHADTLALRHKILGAGHRLQPGQTGRQLEQQREQLPCGESEQQQPEQLEQQQRVPAGSLYSTMDTTGGYASSRRASCSCCRRTKTKHTNAGLVADGERPVSFCFDGVQELWSAGTTSVPARRHRFVMCRQGACDAAALHIGSRLTGTFVVSLLQSGVARSTACHTHSKGVA
ncbi:MAG: RNA-directed DNA polymerase [Spartobacteria bacterium]|nr:RNA-directed DNA polymerase [Spartobacteria bacterium]